MSTIQDNNVFFSIGVNETINSLTTLLKTANKKIEDRDSKIQALTKEIFQLKEELNKQKEIIKSYTKPKNEIHHPQQANIRDNKGEPAVDEDALDNFLKNLSEDQSLVKFKQETLKVLQDEQPINQATNAFKKLPGLVEEVKQRKAEELARLQALQKTGLHQRVSVEEDGSVRINFETTSSENQGAVNENNALHQFSQDNTSLLSVFSDKGSEARTNFETTSSENEDAVNENNELDLFLNQNASSQVSSKEKVEQFLKRQFEGSQKSSANQDPVVTVHKADDVD